jgi:hypothetical protein
MAGDDLKAAMVQYWRREGHKWPYRVAQFRVTGRGPSSSTPATVFSAPSSSVAATAVASTSTSASASASMVSEAKKGSSKKKQQRGKKGKGGGRGGGRKGDAADDFDVSDDVRVLALVAVPSCPRVILNHRCSA